LGQGQEFIATSDIKSGSAVRFSSVELKIKTSILQ